MDLQQELVQALEAIQLASAKVLQIYQQADIRTTYKKEDCSPLTEADLASDQIIVNYLTKQFSYPILSEERAENHERFLSSRVWVLDPLDGTKEFLAKKAEFTINLALLENNQPVLGLVSCPVQRRIYYAVAEEGAYLVDNQKKQRIRVGNRRQLSNLKITVSRSHFDESLNSVLQQIPEHSLHSLGSALKYCAIAEGSMDLTLRKTPLHEWDIAASDCIIREAGGQITNWLGERLTYNRPHTLFDEGIIASNGFLNQLITSLP